MDDTTTPLGVEIKQEPLEPPPQHIKEEPLSPCYNHHPPPGSSTAPHVASAGPSAAPHGTSAGPSAAPLGKFAYNRSTADKTVDLASYQFGLYSYYAEGNRHEFEGDHFDPYYSENDIKDPALLARAKRYFATLRSEPEETPDEYQIRARASPGKSHQPMYERKRKKVRKAVVLVPKVRLGDSLKEYLSARYPPDSSRASRWALRQHCRNVPGLVPQHHTQEDKFREFLLQFQPGSAQHQSRPYSLNSNYMDKTSSTSGYSPGNSREASPVPCSSGYEAPNTTNSSSSHPAESSSFSVTRGSPSPNFQNESHPCSSNPHNNSPLAPPEALIKTEPLECHHATIKEETVEYPHIKQEMLDCPDSENMTPNIPLATDVLPTEKPKKKKEFHPISIKEEPLSVEDVHLDPSENPPATESASVNEDPKPAEVTVKQEPLDPEHMLMVEIFKKRVKKFKQIEVKPIASDITTKEEPVEFEDYDGNLFTPEIKVEPDESNLVFFDRNRYVNRLEVKTNLKPKFVYGKRINRASMSISNPRSQSLDTESEFDKAAQLDTPFSPPKSTWASPSRYSTHSSTEEIEENAGLTAEIDKLIQDGNIESLDDTEKMYHLFAETIRTVSDPKANVFNIVLEKFKERKKLEEEEKAGEWLAEEANTDAKKDTPSEQTDKGDVEGAGKIKLLFPMSDKEIYGQGIKVISETKEPGTFEPTKIKIEKEDAADAAATADLPNVSSIDRDQQPHDQNMLHEGELVIGDNYDESLQPLQSHIEDVVIRQAPPHYNTISYNNYQNQQIEHQYSEHAVDSQSRHSSSEFSGARSKPVLTEAERLFDEMIDEEQVPYQAQESAYMEHYPRNDNLFANSSLDEFIKAPLNTSERLVKPKPSYMRLNYHENSDIIKPPTVLFSSRPEDSAHKDNPEWNHWKRHNESFDQFQASAWSMEAWSPQHSSWNDSYFEHPSTSSASSEDNHKESGRLSNFDHNSWMDAKRMHIQHSMSVIERLPACSTGEEIIRIPVEQRTIQTQFPVPTKHVHHIEVFAPFLTFVTQRQDAVSDVGSQTEDPALFVQEWVHPSHFDGHRSVLVEPLLNGIRMRNPLPIIQHNLSPDETIIRIPVQQRTVQTQFPANNRIYSEFEPSIPFITYVAQRQDAVKDCVTQTDGAPLFPPWVAPGRFRRHRPVLVEPLPNIEPIGDNVRTMRSSDAYSILMEQIRTSKDPSYDKFMNSQHQPAGLASVFNKHACYSPQGNIPQLPLTVNKNYSRKSNNIGKGKRPGISYKEVAPKPYPSQHSNRGLTPYQVSVKIRRMGQVENIIGRLTTKKRKALSPKSAR